MSLSDKKKAKQWGYGGAILFLLALPLFVRGQYSLHILIVAAMNIILATSLRLIATSGQLSLAHGGMMTVGAYTSALLVMKLGISSWAALVLAGLAAAGVALLVGFPFVRIKGIYFAMVTVFFGGNDYAIRRALAEPYRWQFRNCYDPASGPNYYPGAVDHRL